MTLKVAIPNKGSLAIGAQDILKEAGYRGRGNAKDLKIYDINHDVEFYYLRPRDIATYVGSGDLDLGITGRDLVIDSGVKVNEKIAMGFGVVKFRFAAKNGGKFTLKDLQGKRIATSYANLVDKYLKENNIEARIIKLDGAVEISIQLGLADVIADVVESGQSLKQNNLEAFGDPICESEAVLIENPQAKSIKSKEQLIVRVQSVIYAQQFVMLDYDVSNENLEAVLKLTPGLESPTVSKLADSNWCAVRALVPRKDAPITMDKLSDSGAKAILMSDIRSFRF